MAVTAIKRSASAYTPRCVRRASHGAPRAGGAHQGRRWLIRPSSRMGGGSGLELGEPTTIPVHTFGVLDAIPVPRARALLLMPVVVELLAVTPSFAHGSATPHGGARVAGPPCAHSTEDDAATTRPPRLHQAPVWHTAAAPTAPKAAPSNNGTSSPGSCATTPRSSCCDLPQDWHLSLRQPQHLACPHLQSTQPPDSTSTSLQQLGQIQVFLPCLSPEMVMMRLTMFPVEKFVRASVLARLW